MYTFLKFGPRNHKILRNTFKLSSLPDQKRLYSCENPFAKCKVALVTGGASLLGRTFAEGFLKSGAKAVIVADVADNKAVCQLIEKYGNDRVTFEAVDVTDRKKFENVFKGIMKTHGQLDYVVNSAHYWSIDNWQKIICVNNYGLILGTLFGLHYMGLQKCQGLGGTILNVGNIAGLQPFYPIPVYSGAEHFLVQFTRSIGHDFYYLKSNVKVLGLICGPVEGQEFPEPLKKDSPYWDFGNISDEIMRIYEKPPPFNIKCYENAFDTVIVEGKNGEIWVAEGPELFKITTYNKSKLKC